MSRSSCANDTSSAATYVMAAARSTLRAPRSSSSVSRLRDSIADGTAREMLTQPELLAAAGLTPPMPVQMYYDLKQAGIVLARCPLTLEELAEELCRSQ